jgi:hypothetical protein
VIQDAVLVSLHEGQADPTRPCLHEPLSIHVLHGRAKSGRPLRKICRVRGELVDVASSPVDPLTDLLRFRRHAAILSPSVEFGLGPAFHPRQTSRAIREASGEASGKSMTDKMCLRSVTIDEVGRA